MVDHIEGTRTADELYNSDQITPSVSTVELKSGYLLS